MTVATSALVFLALACPIPADAEFDHDHSAWQRLLETVDLGGLIDYERLRAQPAALDDYIAQIAAVDEGDYTAWSPEQRLAFWINAYNAFTVKAVVERYPFNRPWWRPAAYKFPPNSVRQARDFEEQTFTAVGNELSLAEARGYTLALSTDPRLPFAMTCPCLGGPPLPAQAFRAVSLDAQLDAAARAFALNPKNVGIDEKGYVLRLSTLFASPRIGQPAAWLRRYLPPEACPALDEPGWRIEWLSFDWTLDEMADL